MRRTPAAVAVAALIALGIGSAGVLTGGPLLADDGAASADDVATADAGTPPVEQSNGPSAADESDPPAEAGGGEGAANADSGGAPADDGSESDATAPIADADGDGIADGREAALGTDPAVTDSDGDGLVDGREPELRTDPAKADTDGDGLADGRELDLGTDPRAMDADGDGLDDGFEVDGHGTDPAAADSDGDGLRDGRELELGADPKTADTDEDGLADGREAALGTGPTEVDTDSDGLSDGNEVAGESEHGVALPDADPLRMDMYVQLSASANSRPFTDEEVDRLVEAWAEMPVENPDGSTGVALHVDQRALNESVTATERGDYYDLEDRYFSADGERASVLADRRPVYYLVLVVEMESGYAGRGGAGEKFSIVDQSRTAMEGPLTLRTTTAIHELLHNALGRLDERNRCPSEFDDTAAYHSCEGWLSYDNRPDAHYLPESLAAELKAEGIN